MPHAWISQAMARQLRRRVDELEKEEEQRRRRWPAEWPGGTDIGRVMLTRDSALVGSLRTAHKLKHAVVGACDDTGTVIFYALPLAKGNSQ